MSDLGKAYVQIVPSAKGISGSISKELGGEATNAGKSAGLNIAGAIKGAIAAAGIGTAIKAALEAGGNLQQSFGGLDTLYGDAAEGAKKYAAEAAKAGISANSYAEQAVSFGAALKQAFGGDSTKAMEAANTAILDMADNAAKMGTPIENIQNAYQGFAKQNYTMLDNLKLGYGGTKSEMERLLADAQELTGVEYNMDNLGDVYDAIHAIQENLGLTGVAADEASTTFTGSLGAMKAAGENLLANLALGEDIRPALDALGETVRAFMFNNLFPMVSNILMSLPDLLSGIGGIIIQSLNIASNNADEIVNQGIQIVTGLVTAIVEAAPYIVEAAINLAMALGQALINTDWLAIGTDLINTLRDSIELAAGEILGTDDSTIQGLLNGITAAIPGLYEKGTEIISNLMNGITLALPGLLQSGIAIITEVANGIMESLPEIITAAGNLIITFTSNIISALPTILQAGTDLLLQFVQGILNNLPQVVASVVQVIAKFVATITSNLPQILQQGIIIIGKLVAGIIQSIPEVISGVGEIIKSIINAFTSVDWGSVGRNLISGIAHGISSAAGIIADAARSAAQSAFEAAKSFLGINSPATKGIYLGDMYDEGVAVGVKKNLGKITEATDDIMTDAFGALRAPQTTFDVTQQTKTPGVLNLNMTINGAEGQDVNVLAEIIQNKINNAVNQRELVYA